MTFSSPVCLGVDELNLATGDEVGSSAIFMAVVTCIGQSG
jgi:hypothetical protein